MSLRAYAKQHSSAAEDDMPEPMGTSPLNTASKPSMRAPRPVISRHTPYMYLAHSSAGASPESSEKKQPSSKYSECILAIRVPLGLISAVIPLSMAPGNTYPPL